MSSLLDATRTRALNEITPVRDIVGRSQIKLPKAAGLYAFWWIGAKSQLMAAERYIELKGPGGRYEKVEYGDWWPSDLPHPCLYVGKSTNILKRFSLHLKRRCKRRLHNVLSDNKKLKPCTTSCQLRYGIEHVFRNHIDPLAIIYDHVGFSYTTDFSSGAVAERFFAEDLLVGLWRPWFNIDSER
jgi:hypothetical protein